MTSYPITLYRHRSLHFYNITTHTPPHSEHHTLPTVPYSVPRLSMQYYNNSNVVSCAWLWGSHQWLHVCCCFFPGLFFFFWHMAFWSSCSAERSLTCIIVHWSQFLLVSVFSLSAQTSRVKHTKQIFLNRAGLFVHSIRWCLWHKPIAKLKSDWTHLVFSNAVLFLVIW